MVESMKQVTISPDMFISAPYDTCPKCGKADSFGVSNSVGRDMYSRKCKACLYSESYKLPKLNKKIIYIDQFAISDMMKAINKKTGKTDKVNKDFVKLFSELDTLVKSQLILCPDSQFHQEESMLYGYFHALKRMYEHLSDAKSFYDPFTIKRFQISDCFKKWLKKSDTEIKRLDVDSILTGDRNEWQDRWLITVNFKIKKEEIDEYRNSRLQVNEKIKELFEQWKSDKQTFQTFYLKESSAYGPLLVRKYMDAMTKMLQARINNQEISTEEYISLALGQSNTLITNLMRYLPEKMDINDQLKTIFQFFNSQDFRDLPFNKISSALWAAIEYQASTGGRVNPPNVGMTNDVEMVSTLLPYCDAILVDRDMHSILNFGPVKKLIEPYGTKILSFSDKAELFRYLQEIKNKASKKHFRLIESVYGKSWSKPYYEMYE